MCFFFKFEGIALKNVMWHGVYAREIGHLNGFIMLKITVNDHLEMVLQYKIISTFFEQFLHILFVKVREGCVDIFSFCF